MSLVSFKLAVGNWEGLRLPGGSCEGKRGRLRAALGLLVVAALSVGPGKHAEAASDAPESRKPASTATSQPKIKPSATPAVNRGKPPRVPSPTLPEGGQPAAEDTAARRAIAGGAPLTLARAPVNDPELAALREADRALFPKTLVGFRAGWSWGKVNPSVQASGLPPMVDALPSATHPAAADSEWLRSLTLPDLPIRLEERVVEYLRFYRDSPRGQEILKVWARKVGRYTDAMQAELIRAGLPKDLVWLSLIESGHNPTIYSSAGAAGIWQFLPDSGRMYGLTVDRFVDERLDPKRSTEGAAKFLSDLYQRFGTWELAMAAYNMGHAGLLTALRKYNTNDFWKLSEYEAGLPWETTLYVPKVFALAVVMNNRRAFGIGEIAKDPAITFDTVFVAAGAALEDVARAAGIPLESLRSMNPQYLTGRLPPVVGPQASRWPVRVPRNLGKKTAAALLDSAARRSYEAYAVRAGDTLETIARRRKTTPEQLAALNLIAPADSIVPGCVLLVPRLADGQSAVPDDEEIVVVPATQFKIPGRIRIFYRVLSGDTLELMAMALGVSAGELVAWNDLDNGAKLQSGMVLQAFVAKDRELNNVRVVAEQDTRVLVAGSLEFLEYFEAQRGRKRITIRAKARDTLAKIGARYGLSVGMMERINRYSRTRSLTPGEPVVVYAQRGGSDALPAAGRPLAQVDAPRPDLLPKPSNIE